PIYSKLSDQYGRKPMILVGIGGFLLGSVLCGVAWSMPALIAFRALPGLGAGAVLPMVPTILGDRFSLAPRGRVHAHLARVGAGAVMPMVLTIVGDLFSLAERGRVQGYFASVWAIAAVVGPALGGVFAEYLTWRWIFFVNIPLCLLAAATLLPVFHENVARQR